VSYTKPANPPEARSYGGGLQAAVGRANGATEEYFGLGTEATFSFQVSPTPREPWPHSRKKLGRIQNRGCHESPWRMKGLGSRLAVASAYLQSRDREGAGPDHRSGHVAILSEEGPRITVGRVRCLPASVCRYRSFAITALSNGCSCMISYPMKFQLSVSEPRADSTAH